MAQFNQIVDSGRSIGMGAEKNDFFAGFPNGIENIILNSHNLFIHHIILSIGNKVPDTKAGVSVTELGGIG
ncbi:hypothetical protein AGMMS50293_15160 [Spirochaetia bacterium]|nr:hypothetical protein AGMMS50293_15160 [Spirochaetia bacterium]